MMKISKIKWIHWSWFFLSLLFLFFRLQNFRGVFTPEGVIVNDTDPYYRLHRIDVMLNEHKFYPFHEIQLNYPDGIDISWPLGLDLLVALPLKLYNSTSHAEIESFAAIIIPFLSLPLLWFAGWIGNFLGGPLLGLLLGLLVSCSSTLIYQTGLGRLDHHFLESTFPVVLLMFLLKYIQTRQRFLFVGIVLLLGFAPSFAPQGWVIGAFLATGFLWARQWNDFHSVSKMFLYAFAISLLPLSISDRFVAGYISWGSFSWWATFVYLMGACTFEILHVWKMRTSSNKAYRIALGFCMLVVSIFLWSKNHAGFFVHNVREAVNAATVKTGTMATTLEARSPFDLSWDTWMHSDMIMVIAAAVCFAFLIFVPRYRFIIGYIVIALILSMFQVRLASMALPLLFLIVLLFFRDWIEKIPVKRHAKTLILIAISIILIIPFQPFFGLTEYENTHYYFRPIRTFSFFLKNEYQTKHLNPKDKAIIAHWDYGHWLLYYTGLSVVADPFQGPSAYEVLQLFTSKGTDELKPFLQRHPSKYLVIESGAQRAFQWLQAVHKDTNIYFDKLDQGDGKDYFRTTPAFDKLFMYRYFFELGRGLDNNHPKDWRLIYISPYSAPTDPDISSLKVFEHVPGFTIEMETKKPYKELYLQAQVNELGDAVVYQQMQTGPHHFTFTVPYGYYDRGNVSFSGMYEIRDNQGNVVYNVPQVSEEQVLQGDHLEVRF